MDPDLVRSLRIETAEAEAKRFLQRVSEWRTTKRDVWSSSAQHAAMKRSSMDLTRALADVRRSPYNG